MQPRFTSLWLDADLERVVGAQDERFEWIKPRFAKHAGLSYQDFNLNPTRWAAVSQLYDMSLWRDRCVAARERSEAILREQSGLPKWSQECVEKAKIHGNMVQQQFRSRLALANGETKASLELDLEFEGALLEAQIQSYSEPDLRADSVGAVFLSREMPFMENDRREEDD